MKTGTNPELQYFQIKNNLGTVFTVQPEAPGLDYTMHKVRISAHESKYVRDYHFFITFNSA